MGPRNGTCHTETFFWGPNPLTTTTFMRQLIRRKDPENREFVAVFLGYILFREDYRRHIWVLDVIRECMSSNDDVLIGNAATTFGLYQVHAHLRANAMLTEFARTEIIPRILPMSSFSEATIKALAIGLTSIMYVSRSPLPKYSYDLIRIIFEDVIDKCLDGPNDSISIFLGNIMIPEIKGGEFIVPYVADRIVKFFGLRNVATTDVIPTIEDFLCELGRLPWASCETKLIDTLRALSSTYSSSAWFVRINVIHFIHMLCFCNFWCLSEQTQSVLLKDIIPLFIKDEKDELRREGIIVTRMLIPLSFDNFGEFYSREVLEASNNNIGCANGLSLLGLVEVFPECPVWLADLLEYLERSHQREPKYRDLIASEFASFWNSAGSREVPEIENHRLSFGHN